MKSESDAAKLEPKLKELSLLFELSQAIARSLNLKEIVGPILKLMAEHMGMLRGTIALVNKNSGDIMIEEAYGLSDSEQARGKYKIGEGITGKVVETGKPVVIPKIKESPFFLDRTGARRDIDKKDISFICVPIKIGNQTVGALSVDRLFGEQIILDEDVRLLTIISSMISQAVKVRLDAQAERISLLEENKRLQQELKDRFRPSNIIGNSNKMGEVYDLIAQVAGSDTSVLIQGESGTGKELVAHAIHFNSLRSKKPFIKVNCAALPESVIESELFGHEKGAFTGAMAQRKGRFELAEGGTLFFDEIGDLSGSIQIKLLRVLQEKEFERVGGNQTIHTNVRIIAATHRNLEELIEKEQFRQDLFYRLNVFPIHIPPLRDRKSDILLLCDHFIEKYNRKSHKNIKRISTPAIDMLMSYHWPGNVRELENCIERAVVLSTDGVIHGHHLPPSLQTAEATQTGVQGTLKENLQNVERELIFDALKSNRGNMAKAAAALGITERIMGLRVNKYGIDYKKLRPHH
ncbi:MAG: sigma 54-interacting transcriptional regulator [Spirochaetales bacterium]|nr:sigma 54-interacting transcriptional regulator [Spirochaetales bacterium]